MPSSLLQRADLAVKCNFEYFNQDQKVLNSVGDALCQAFKIIKAAVNYLVLEIMAHVVGKFGWIRTLR